jgi:hypothetical protein
VVTNSFSEFRQKYEIWQFLELNKISYLKNCLACRLLLHSWNILDQLRLFEFIIKLSKYNFCQVRYCTTFTSFLVITQPSYVCINIIWYLLVIASEGFQHPHGPRRLLPSGIGLTNSLTTTDKSLAKTCSFRHCRKNRINSWNNCRRVALITCKRYIGSQYLEKIYT